MTTNLIPGKEVHRFQTKSGEEAVTRLPRWEDLPALTEYINTISQEDTYITVFNREISYEEETTFLSKVFYNIESKKELVLLCFVGETLVAVSTFKKDNDQGERDSHVVVFGISVKQEYRNSGIGYTLSSTIIKEGMKHIPDTKIIRLNVYGDNEQAIHLYEKLGFKEYGRLPGGIQFHEKYIDNISMYLETSKIRNVSFN